jgi:hypothetical protein
MNFCVLWWVNTSYELLWLSCGEQAGLTWASKAGSSGSAEEINTVQVRGDSELQEEEVGGC